MRNEIEEGDRLQLDFTKLGKAVNCGEGLIPAVAQDIATETVLMVGYVNQQALDTAIAEKWQPSGVPAEMSCGSRERLPGTT